MIHPVQNVLVDTDWTDHYKHDPAFKNKLAEDGSVLDPTKFYRGRFWDDDLILVPKGKISEVLTDHHDTNSAGHWGTKKTLDIIQRKFKFPNLADILLNNMCSPATFANTLKLNDASRKEHCNS